jgi:serine/threonine protein phosphatase 1
MLNATYAIGDIHGRLDLLQAALLAIHDHSRGAYTRIIMLGDYVDRGPDSRGVVEYLVARAERENIVCLKGNHEAMMVEAIRGRDLGRMSRWMFHGGEETMRSYGWTGRHVADSALIPHEHLEWMANLPLMFRDAERVYVHAGLDPSLSVDEQSERDCLWMREPFLSSPLEALDLHVVHGHTPEWRGKTDPRKIEALPGRTNLDTGAYMTGVLVIGVFDGGRPGGPVDVLSVSSPADHSNRVALRWRRPQAALGHNATGDG